jgi:hypothetical protein
VKAPDDKGRPHRYILGEDGESIPCPDFMAWAMWIENNRDAILLARDHAFGLTISTVFLGLDHSFAAGESARPLLWETGVFRKSDMVDCQRCSTRAEALLQHKLAVVGAAAGRYAERGQWN